MNDDKLRVLVLDINSKVLLDSLKKNYLFSVTTVKLRTVKITMKPDVIILDYSKIHDSYAMQKKIINLIYNFELKPVIIACMDSWEHLLYKQAKLFGVDKTFTLQQLDETNNCLTQYILDNFVEI